jgi:hypothetical protein
MDYSRRLNLFQIESDRSGLKYPERGFTIIGNYDINENNSYRPREPLKLRELINESRVNWPGIVSIYLYEQLSDQQLEDLSVYSFKNKTTVQWDKIFAPCKKINQHPGLKK